MSRIAVVQMASGPNVQANLLEADRLIAQAVAHGADLVVLPENFALMGREEGDQLEARETFGQGPIQEFLARFPEFELAADTRWSVGQIRGPREMPIRVL